MLRQTIQNFILEVYPLNPAFVSISLGLLPAVISTSDSLLILGTPGSIQVFANLPLRYTSRVLLLRTTIKFTHFCKFMFLILHIKSLDPGLCPGIASDELESSEHVVDEVDVLDVLAGCDEEDDESEPGGGGGVGVVL